MIKIDGIDFGYTPNKKLFDSLDLFAEKGNIYGLLGRNGAGKTTLLRLMSGLLFPEGGSIRVGEFEAKERPPELLANIFFLPEEPYFPRITGKRFLSLYAPLYPLFDRELFRTCIRDFEYDLSAIITSQSYGQRKKFILSFAIASGCGLVLLDEPTNGLDIPAKRIFRKMLSAVIDENKTIIIATHQVRDMEHIIDPIIILENAKVVFNRSSFDISKNLCLKLREDEPRENSVYYEKVFGGYASLERNAEGIEKEIDIEFLFNAVTTNHEKINGLFQGDRK